LGLPTPESLIGSDRAARDCAWWGGAGNAGVAGCSWRKCASDPATAGATDPESVTPASLFLSILLYFVTTQVDRLKAFSLQPAIEGFISA
jgi:hypothetical protein